MARLSFIVAAAAAGCAAFTAPARTPMALSTPVHISSRGALNRAPYAIDATPARRRGCAVSHRGSPNWLIAHRSTQRRTNIKAGPFDDPDAYVAPSPPPKGRLGSSVDQDGKSNIWAVEPKMAVDQDAGASGGGLIAIGAGAVLALGLIAGAFLFINVEQ